MLIRKHHKLEVLTNDLFLNITHQSLKPWSERFRVWESIILSHLKHVISHPFLINECYLSWDEKCFSFFFLFFKCSVIFQICSYMIYIWCNVQMTLRFICGDSRTNTVHSVQHRAHVCGVEGSVCSGVNLTTAQEELFWKTTANTHHIYHWYI